MTMPSSTSDHPWAYIIRAEHTVSEAHPDEAGRVTMGSQNQPSQRVVYEYERDE